MPPLQVLFVILPLGLDTLAVSLGLGIKSSPHQSSDEKKQSFIFSYWLRLAILFSLAESLMPAIGLLAGFTVSSLLSNIMHYIGAILLIGLGARELWEEGREYLRKMQRHACVPDLPRSHSRGGDGVEEGRGPLRSPLQPESVRSRRRGGVEEERSPSEPVQVEARSKEHSPWRRQLLLALSVSMDELAVGFSLGSITSGKGISPLVLCVLIGLQAFLVTITGLFLGRTLRLRLKPLQEGSELVAALLLIGLGVWLLVS